MISNFSIRWIFESKLSLGFAASHIKAFFDVQLV